MKSIAPVSKDQPCRACLPPFRPTPSPFKIGSTLQLELYDYDEAVTCKVVVVRVVDQGSTEAATYPTGFGVRIVELDADGRARLDHMISRIKSGEVY